MNIMARIIISVIKNGHESNFIGEYIHEYNSLVSSAPYIRLPY